MEQSALTAPANLYGCVQQLVSVAESRGLELCLDLYSKLLSAINHAMWIEVWNSLAGIMMSGKMHEKSADTITAKMSSVEKAEKFFFPEEENDSDDCVLFPRK